MAAAIMQTNRGEVPTELGNLSEILPRPRRDRWPALEARKTRPTRTRCPTSSPSRASGAHGQDDVRLGALRRSSPVRYGALYALKETLEGRVCSWHSARWHGV